MSHLRQFDGATCPAGLLCWRVARTPHLCFCRKKTRLAQAAVRQTLYATESVVLPAPALYVREAARVFDATGQLADAGIQKQLENVLVAFAQWIELIGTGYRR